MENKPKHVVIRDALRSYCNDMGEEWIKEKYGVTQMSFYNWRDGRHMPPVEIMQDAVDFVTERVVVNPLMQWSGRNVMLAMPMYDSITAHTFYSLTKAMADYGREKLGLLIQERTRIEEARNMLAERFLKSGAEWLIMMDDDMVIPCGVPEYMNELCGGGVPPQLGSLNAISRIMEHGEGIPIVGALYWGRRAKEQRPQCRDGMVAKANAINGAIGTGLVKQEWVGTGFMRIHRSVFLAMIDHAEMWPEIQPQYAERYGFFTPGKGGLSEDAAFCRRAGDIGIPSFLDTNLICLHRGEVYYGPENVTKF